MACQNAQALLPVPQYKTPYLRLLDNRHQVQPTLRHRDVGDIRGPDLVRMLDFQVPQQVGIHFMLLIGFARVELGVQRLYAHRAHQTLNTFAVNGKAMFQQFIAYSSAAVERQLEVNFVD